MTTKFKLIEEKLEKNHPVAVGHRILVQVLDVQDKTKGGYVD